MEQVKWLSSSLGYFISFTHTMHGFTTL